MFGKILLGNHRWFHLQKGNINNRPIVIMPRGSEAHALVGLVPQWTRQKPVQFHRSDPALPQFDKKYKRNVSPDT